ncbi:E3 ubiquitin-protein ligase MYCBP2 isoform X3 [Galleria mellonella]|uniref:RCR-type E3 ubiquitin transferase n=1 Tax=Galleria mellonella TaxID=7137 RepID=A0ABM3MN75_GALME|nr:E3 ubiquitin-protein ligase MYCBP2 isoform X3 [Galleria mellonella]
MALKAQVPELKCMEPENYRKYFRALCWSGTRKIEKKSRKLGKKEKQRRQKAANAIPMCYAPALLGNPSQFAVFASVRKSILARWRHLHGTISELSDDSDNEESSQPTTVSKLPKVTGIGLRTVFALISQARFTDAKFCEQALKALLDVLQGHTPEELAQEPTEIISSLHAMLVEVATGSGPSGRSDTPTNLTALSSSCLIALSVARGEAELILNAVASLIMSASLLAEQYVQVPTNLTTLQRSVQAVILGKPSRNQWLNYGVPHQALVTSFPVDLPSQLTAGSGDVVVRSLVSDGCYLYVYTSKGLLKIGSGYGSSIKQHVYIYKPDFFPSERHGWLGYCKNKLYVRIGRKKTELYEIDKDTLEVKGVVRLDPGPITPVDPKSAVFSDGNLLGLVLLTSYECLTIRLYDVDSPRERTEASAPATILSHKEMIVHLLRRHMLVIGRSPFEDGFSRRSMEVDTPMAVQLDDDEEDPMIGISAGQDFCLLNTLSGRVYYTGKGASLGYKTASPLTNRWTLMKETVYTRNDIPNVKKGRVMQVAVGHEGVHAILVMDNGTALFTGVARRGEDGDSNKHRRTPKPTRPKKIFKAEGHSIVYAACNYGSTALVTKQGLLLMLGKDAQHCDSTGLVVGLRHERVVQVALGKAHAVALTHFGLVYTFGINNKGQCGREFGFAKEKSFGTPRRQSGNKEEVRMCSTHKWVSDYCRICVMCRECTGFSNSCHLSHLPNRAAGEKCGCGEGDSGCSSCGVCRRCAETQTTAGRSERTVTDLDDDADASTRSDSKTDKDGRYHHYDSHAGSEGERDASLKVSCLPPARVAIPGGQRVSSVACGLHHTVLLTEHGEILTFGSNQYGQLGAGDVSPHHKIVRVRVPRCIGVAAGSNHTALLTAEGEVYTFGCYQKGALGRPRIEEVMRSESNRSPIWYATPGRVPRLGPRHTSKGVAISASGDQTFIQVSQSVIRPEFLFSSTITSNHNTIVILPNRSEHTFKCITVNKTDGNCFPWTGGEQVDFANSLACLDPLYDVMWCYQPLKRVMKCYNILTFDSNKLQRCCTNNPDAYTLDADYEYPNYGSMKRLEDFKNLETLDLKINNEDRPTDNIALSNMSVLNQELAIPSAPSHSVTRMHAALHLLGCLDSLTFAHDSKLNQVETKRDRTTTPVAPIKEDFLTVNRFESHGGGWGYSGHSVEAIRFMCDTDILLGGYGLFGGRGDYTAKIKLFDIGGEGGDQEGDGELIAESDEVMYECAPRDKFPVLFDVPVPLAANRWYVAWACVNGPSSDCGSSGQAMVINDEIGFHFKTSKKSNNGTDVNAGQIPCLLYNTVSPDHTVTIRCIDLGDPIISLSKNISRKVTVSCFKSLITLLQWSWKTFKEIILETNGQIPINYQKLTVMKHQKRLVYVIRASLRLVKSYIIEIYPQHNKKRNSHEYMSYFEAIAEARNFIQGMMAEPTPTCSMLPRKPGKNKAHRVCYVQFALEMTNSILKEAHDTITTCFHAFFPTPTLKWNHLCSLLFHVKEGVVPATQIRELASCCAAMCSSRSLRDVLQYVVPVTQNHIMLNENRRPDSKVLKEIPSKSATVPRSSHAQKPPPIPPRAHHKDAQKAAEPIPCKSTHIDWHLLDVIPKLLDIVMIPIKQQMKTRQCGQPHDHGEIGQHETLSEYCCKLVARIIAELSFSATNIREDQDTNTIKHLVTPSRFMRVNQSRAWNTGNGSPDAICFTVDRPGVMLVGACVFSGLGNYEYTLELLQDLRLRATGEESDPGHCWVSVEIIHGTFTSADCHHDMVQIKFERPISLKEDLRYAIRLCNHGGRTANGDCGLPSVKGPDGTTFKFSSCSLSFNGTTLARGQIPSLIYYGTSKSQNSLESPDTLISALRAITLRVASVVIERSADLFCSLRNEVTAEDLRRNAAVLQQSPVINTLIPYTLANLEGLDDSKSVIKLLEIIHKILPHVAAMNLLVPAVEEFTTTTTHFYTWVESDHPYKQATVTNMRVLFPTNVSWVVLEMDPRSVTAQPEDTLTVYAVAGAPKNRCQNSYDMRIMEPPFRKRLIQMSSDNSDVDEVVDEGETDAPCMHYNCAYVNVTPKLANIASEWPQKALIVPGNEVIFSLETASDYLNEYNKSNSEDNHYGFRCLCIGYEDSSFTTQRQGLAALEMELVYAGAACASRLLAPDLDIPPLTFATIVEVQMLAMIGSSPGAEGDSGSHDGSEYLLLSRGLELSSPPTIHQVLDGQPLLRCISTERQFLSDFVAGAESTAGGRLARWLAPTSRVEPSKCEMKAPATPPRPSAKSTLPITVRDQYGEIVASPALKVEVVVQRMEETNPRHSRSSESHRGSLPDVSYQPTMRDTMCFHAITMMKPFQIYSFEELRYLSGQWGGSCAGAGLSSSGRVPTERLPVRSQPDGSYVAVWTPRAPGVYVFRCTLDDQPAPQELTVEVAEGSIEVPEERGVQAGDTIQPAPPPKLRRFIAKYSAGLRVRASPSLQAEELGRVPPGANVAFVEELVNKDGTWVRLSDESARAYTDGGAEIAWCLQHHRHLDRALLVPVEPCSPIPQLEYTGLWSGYGDAQGDIHSWTHEEDIEVGTSDQLTCPDDYDRRFPFCVLADVTNEVLFQGDRASSPFMFGVEPSKLERVLRNEACSSPKRMLRRSNGNSDEWCSPMHRLSDNVRNVNTIPEADIEPELERRTIKLEPEHHSEMSAPHPDCRSEQLALEPGPNSQPDPQSRTGSRLAQAGTQTSPEHIPDVSVTSMQMYIGLPKEGRMSPKSIARERIANRSRAYRRTISPPPLPARTAPAPPPPRKHALSPAQAECLRAIFAALLWHEGIVHDAIACAAFLKFHPQLPKQGARVVTRGLHDVTSPRLQRHSVEVSNAGQYLRINPSTLETLTRSGVEATTSRSRKSDVDVPIREEDTAQPSSSTGSTPSVVNVLPPALRALVALWDAMYEADQLTAATDKLKKDETEKNENEDGRSFSGIRKKRDWKSLTKTPYSVRCELCGGASVAPPIAAHLRHSHPGCKLPTVYGYDRSGVYRPTDPTPAHADAPSSACGQLAQTYELWYIYCEKCRDKALKAASSIKQSKTKIVTEPGFERADPLPEVDHHIMKDNAVFLLDLAPLTYSESMSTSPWHEAPGRSPPTPPGSMWQPAPPFQCLAALGAAPKPLHTTVDTARYHSLGRPPTSSVTSHAAPYGSTDGPPGSNWLRVHRSVSMGQEKGRDLSNAGRPPLTRRTHPDSQDTLSGAGSSLLAQPSAALHRLVGCGAWSKETCSVSAFEPSRVDPEALMRSPVLTFVLARRDLHAYRQKMDAAIRINTVRQYAFEALNWLLRSATQPTCVHDVMWWFCSALDKYARIVPPPLSLDDNKENIPESTRNTTPTASASAICPGGRSARGARAAFHAFLGSVSALAPSLPPSSASGLQAVRCWALHYSPHDRAFLHRSQVFSVISKILSHSEDGIYDDGMLGALHESYHSYHNKENYVWSCPDVTGWCDITVSSRQGMAGALTDGSTETFWESGDEDRNKAKWIQVSYPGGTPEDRPHIVAVHIDNTRDTVNKTLLISFLYAGGSSEMFHMQDIEVDSKTATWLCYTLPRVTSPSLRVRCELRGPEPAVRVRQVRILSAPAPVAAQAASPAQVLHGLSEADTLRVFRLLTSQVFGKLLEWDRSGSESGNEGATGGEEAAPTDDSDLREHVVGILFAGHKLTSLQRQVMSHIVCAIGCEASRVRDDWETALLCAEAAERATDDSIHRPVPHAHTQDNYCFEMLSLLLALSGSAVGRAHLAQQTELLADLLALLHTGSERVQRQVISLLRRIITEIPPQKMFAAVNYKNELNTRVTLLDHLVAYLGKAITVQVKIKGSGPVQPKPVMMGGSVSATPPATWFMKGETTKKHAHLVAKLLSDMAEDKISLVWGPETRSALANYVLQVAQLGEEERGHGRCVHSPPMWMALAALCVCEQSHVEIINGVGDGRECRRDAVEARPFCSNHDDGATLAVIECRTCGPLCGECDRFLHLNRSARTHQRQLCKEEESAIRIDIHEGCGRAKLFWLLLLVDRRTLKALAEFREMETMFDPSTADGTDGAVGAVGYSGTCRFCGTRSTTGLLAIGNVCADQQCQEHGRQACNRVLSCGHMCGGVRCERTCLPCLFGCSGRGDSAPLRQDADDMCMICFTDPLQAAPAIQLKCGHVFHLHCCKKVLANKWIGPRITFSFSQCPICKEDMEHWTLEELLAPIQQLREEVKRKALMRLEYEGVSAPGGARGRMPQDPAAYAMERYAYYVCHKCEKAYFGGLARCEAETSGWWEPAELVCGACSDIAGARTCPKHGADFLEYKCRYCCSVAVFFCFGTSHFCNACHDDFQRVTNIPKHLLPQCPAGPKGEQLPGSSEECPLHVQHPPTGEEFALGCGVCRHAQAF